MCVVADTRVAMLVVWKDSIEVETMVLLMDPSKNLRRAFVKAVPMV